jgi:hypothetical protein
MNPSLLIGPHINKLLFKESGTCVRCGESIKYNPSKSFCIDCYSKWAEWENEYYTESNCHKCDKKKEDISFAKPQCYSYYEY